MDINMLEKGHRAGKWEKELEPKIFGVLHYTSDQLGDIQKDMPTFPPYYFLYVCIGEWYGNAYL